MTQFTRLDGDRKTRSTDLGEILGSETEIARERWMWLTPHDDDAPFGGGLWMQAGQAAGAEQHILVVTDGRMGYCSASEKVRIVDVRAREALQSFELLGLDATRLSFLGFPDCQLDRWCGRRVARAGDSGVIEGYTGLQNAFTAHLRRVRPQRVFLPGAADLHPDHQLVHRELLISVYHACGDIWPELGPPIPRPPRIYEMALYCDFATPPNLELAADEEAFARKKEAMQCFRSQKQSAEAAALLAESGPYEYLHEFEFPRYRPAVYRARFQ